ncbi:MAG: alkaline phosphatase family protein [Polyangiales bacterium]
MHLRTVASTLTVALLCACSSTNSAQPGTDSGTGSDGSVSDTGGGGGDAGNDVTTSDTSPGSDTGGHSEVGTTDTGIKHDSATDTGGTGGPPFAAGTVCNASGTKLTPPATLKNIIVFLMENENYGSVNGSKTKAPYINSIAAQCGVATAYDDNCFGSDNLVSLPHYLALVSGSNCNTGLDQSDSSCITDDNDATSHTLSTTSIFSQVSSWKSYQEDMPSNCDQSSSGNYATKHNPAAYFTSLSDCSANDLPIATISCSSSKTGTPCTPAPSNAFTQDLANDTLAQFTFVTPTLLNDMHDGTITEADNWLSTYLPLVLASKAYLRGDVAVYILWDEQNTSSVGGPTPNVFVSPYITAGTTTATVINHFSVLRSWENALGISTYLGCASGTIPGGGACPAGSTADVRAALNF